MLVHGSFEVLNEFKKQQHIEKKTKETENKLCQKNYRSATENEQEVQMRTKIKMKSASRPAAK